MSLFLPPPVCLRHTRETTIATSRYRRAVAALMAVGIAALASPSVMAKTDGEIAPVHRAAQPIKDAQGRIQMIVDFDFEPKEDTEFENTMSPADARTWGKQQGKVVNLINSYEKTIGFTRSGMTSWAKVSATAFLDEKQIDKLARDKRVTLLTENEPVHFSASLPYGNTVVGNEHRSWGYQATNGKSGHSFANGRDVYIIDSGVAVHSDLPNVVSRVNVACGSGGNCSTGTSGDLFPVVGCNAHATHVAGIIGARGNTAVTNAAGAGVYDGARMHSVAVLEASSGSFQEGKCGGRFPALSAANVDSIRYALDYVYRQVLGPAPFYSNRGVAIVNMSMNPGRLGFNGSGQGETNRAALMKLVTPSSFWVNEPARGGWVRVDYPGAFFVQSAGNSTDRLGAPGYDPVGGRNLCTQFSVQPGMPSLAYTHAWPNNNTTSMTDGVMVVGAMHHDGKAADRGAQPSVPLSGQFDSLGLRALNDHSSHYGPCIDVWAPGNLIYSTWGLHYEVNEMFAQVGPQYSANQTTGNSGWTFLSGSSMAAPHVAGAAAWLADTYGLTTPAQIEQAVRQRFKLLFNGVLPILDRAGAPINIVELP